MQRKIKQFSMALTKYRQTGQGNLTNKHPERLLFHINTIQNNV